MKSFEGSVKFSALYAGVAPYIPPLSPQVGQVG